MKNSTDSTKNSNSNKFHSLAIAFFILSVWYAVLVDLPAGLANIFVSKNNLYSIPANFNLVATSTLERLYALLQGSNFSEGIPWHKLGKDLLLLVSLFFASASFFREGNFKRFITLKSPIWIGYFSLLILILFLSVVSFLQGGFWQAMIGLRAHLALAAFIVGVNLVNGDLRKIWDWIKPLLIIELLLSLAQRWFQIQNQVWDFQERSQGSFFEINTFGMFVSVCLIFALLYSRSQRVGWIYSLIVLAMIVLTRSRTALLLFVIIIGIYIWTRIRSNKLKALTAGIIVVLLPFVPYLLESVSGRQEVIQNFLALRGAGPTAFFREASLREIIFGKGLGRGTTLLISMSDVSGILPDVSYDNLVGSELVQGGLLLLLLNFTFALSPIIRSQRRFLPLVLVAFTLMASVAIPFWEVWPANILIIMLYGYLAGVQFEQNGNIAINSTKDDLDFIESPAPAR